MNLVFNFLENKIKLTRNDSVVVGVSSGPDSMCLLSILMKLQETIGFRIIVAHINHNKRKESEIEEQFLEEYSRKNDLIFEKMKIDSYKHDNFHKVARDIRYRFYEELINKYQASYLLTAHHGDDLMETILMRLVRGSTLFGYHGISLVSHRKRYLILRPLLYVTKKEIEEYNQLNHIPYYVDASNFSDKYTRNRYRKNVLPFLKEEDDKVHLKFLKFSHLLEDTHNYIEKVVLNAYNNIYKEGSLDLLSFKELDLFIQKLVLEKVLLSIYDDLSEIKDKHIELLLDLIKKNKSGVSFNLPNSLVAYIDYDKLTFNYDNNIIVDYCYPLADGLVLPNGMKFTILCDNSNGNDTLHLSSLDIKLPLYVRNKREGDFIELKGMNGKRRVSDIFIDEKISKFERNSYPVVCDSLGKVVWIPKLKKSKYDSQKTKKCDIIFKCL